MECVVADGNIGLEKALDCEVIFRFAIFYSRCEKLVPEVYP